MPSDVSKQFFLSKHSWYCTLNVMHFCTFCQHTLQLSSSLFIYYFCFLLYFIFILFDMLWLLLSCIFFYYIYFNNSNVVLWEKSCSSNLAFYKTILWLIKGWAHFSTYCHMTDENMKLDLFLKHFFVSAASTNGLFAWIPFSLALPRLCTGWICIPSP